MKVLFQGRLDLFDRRGGDTVQMENTAEALKKLGVEVDIDCSLKPKLASYDLVHIFGLDWISEPYFFAKNAKLQNKPIVLSPIHHSEVEVKRFEQLARYDFRRISNIMFSSQQYKDIYKNVYRALFDVRKIKPTLTSIFKGLRNMQRETLEMANAIIVQTHLETADLAKDFGMQVQTEKIVNGVGLGFLQADSVNKLGFSDYIITVGRIEARKNQLTIIQAVEKLRAETKLDLQLVIVGAFNSHNLEFGFRFRRMIKGKNWIHYIPKVEYSNMPAMYKNAKVCVSASWFETSGLTLLEAIFSGCNVVASGKRAKEYLGNMGYYCDPASLDSVADGIKAALEAKRPQPTDEMKAKYTWDEVATSTLNVYNKLINYGHI